MKHETKAYGCQVKDIECQNLSFIIDSKPPKQTHNERKVGGNVHPMQWARC